MPNLMDEAEFQARFIAALGELAEDTWRVSALHEHRPTQGPRMSGLGSCARQQFYEIAGAMETNPKDDMSNWPAMLGTVAQSLTALVLRRMGYEVTNEEDEVSLLDGLVLGHIDGLLAGLDLENTVAVWDSKYRNVWGLFGTNNSLGLVLHGLPVADPIMYLQMQAYMAATGTKQTIITAHPFDLSAARVEAAKRKAAISPVYRIVVEADEEAQAVALDRAKTLMVAVDAKLLPAREYDPLVAKFPCGYCAWQAQCIADGADFDIQVTPLPLEWSMATMGMPV